MTRTSRTILRAALVIFFAALLALLEYMGARQRLQTDLLSLIPDTGERSVVEKTATREVLAGQSRVVALRFIGPEAEKSAASAAERLSASGIAKAEVLNANRFDKAAATIFASRMTLLFPRRLAQLKAEYDSKAPRNEDFESWLSARVVADMGDFLAEPESLVLGELLPKDPFLLMSSCVNAMPTGTDHDGVVVMAMLEGNALDKTTQLALLRELDGIRKTLPAGTQMHATGAAIFANRSEALIKADVTRLNIVMTLLLFGAALWLLRSFRTTLIAIVPVLVSWAAAFVAVFAVDWQVYALALGMGSILGGISIDYSIHIMFHIRRGESSYIKSALRIARPLALGCLTTVAVFVALLFSDLQLIQQVGMLVVCGIVFCAIAVLPCLEAFPPTMDTQKVVDRLERFNPKWLRSFRVPIIGAMILACLGIMLLKSNDDIAVLQPAMPDLYAEDAIVRAGAFSNPCNMFIASASDMGSAADAARTADPQGLTGLISTSAECKAADEWITHHGKDFQIRLNGTLEASGYDSQAFSPLFDESNTGDCTGRREATLEKLAAALPAGLDWTMGKANGAAWLVCESHDTLSTTPAGVQPLDVRARINGAFRAYRQDCVRFTLAGFAAASLLVIIPLGPRRGLRVLLVPLLAVGTTLGMLGMMGEGINLFHIVGLLLGYGLAMDNALFTHDPASGRASVRFSAITTLCSAAALIISTIPAVRGLGLSLFMVILFTLLQCELSPLPSDEPDR